MIYLNLARLDGQGNIAVTTEPKTGLMKLSRV